RKCGGTVPSRPSRCVTRWGGARSFEQLIYKLGLRQRGWKCVCETRALHEVESEGLLVNLQQLLPTWLQHNYSQINLLGISQKLAETNNRHRERMVPKIGRGRGRIAVSNL